LPIPGGSFQSSDVLKFGLIIWLAWYVSKNYQKMRHFVTGLLKPGLVLGVIVVLLMKQPHLSCVIIMGVIFVVMVLVGGANFRLVMTCALIGIPCLILLINISGYSYFRERLTMDPLADPSDTTYQTYQAILAIGSGGLWGKGFDHSTQKYYYLPEAQNDFVYAICCEEFGFIGGALIILLFIIFLLRGFYIGRKSQDRFGLMLATGISLQVGAQALFNIGVNVCALPNTGISLPFFSYGGTALFVLLCEIGVLLSISRRANLN
ncbi:MAG: FtsW/RodA/SpoVE family cell cycle protein, partial [Eggerthellaceae bacterium]